MVWFHTGKKSTVTLITACDLLTFNLNQSTFVTKAKAHDPISCLHTLHQPQPPLPGFKFIKIYFLIKPGFSFYISLKVIIELHINLFLGHLVWSHMRCKTGPKGFDKSKDWFIHGAKRTAPKKTLMENDSLFFVFISSNIKFFFNVPKGQVFCLNDASRAFWFNICLSMFYSVWIKGFDFLHI